MTTRIFFILVFFFLISRLVWGQVDLTSEDYSPEFVDNSTPKASVEDISSELPDNHTDATEKTVSEGVSNDTPAVNSVDAGPPSLSEKQSPDTTVSVSPELKQLQISDVPQKKVDVNLGDDQIQPEEKETYAKSEPEKLDMLGFWFAGGVLLGSGIHEIADNRNDFNAQFAIGPLLKTRFIQFNAFRVGLNAAFIHFTHELFDGNDTISVRTKYNRLQSVATIQFHTHAFFLTGLFGAAFTIVSVESSLTQEGTTEKSVATGLDVSYLMGLDVGVEFGKHLLKLNREMEMAVQSDWTRRGERDEFVIFFNFNIEILSSFSG